MSEYKSATQGMAPPNAGQSNAPHDSEQKHPADQSQNKPRKAPRGFAAMDPERQRAIASKGGRSVPDSKRSFSQNRGLAAQAGRKGGQESGGNFRNDPERAAAAGRKGGSESGGNFANDRARAAEAGRKGGLN
jgi:general stress protein YciG